MKYYIVYTALEKIQDENKNEEKITTGCVEVGLDKKLTSMNDIVHLALNIEKKFNLKRVVITNWKELGE